MGGWNALQNKDCLLQIKVSQIRASKDHVTSSEYVTPCGNLEGEGIIHSPLDPAMADKEVLRKP